jgi:exopolyphosphatase/guanosine-5'-triphosphate,3'-diphosphate pyrophosphatase
VSGSGGDCGSKGLVGAIDIGTNSVLLLICEQDERGLTALVDRATITRLGEGVDRSRRLDRAAVERTLACLRGYAAELSARGVSRLGAVGTSALRDAEGGQDFLNAAEAILGSRPQVISGVTEAELTFEGALSGLALDGRVTVFDVGGGSTEIIAGQAGRALGVESAVSLDIGSVRLHERHVVSDPPSAVEVARAIGDIERALASAPPATPSAVLVGVAGTVTTLAAISLGLDAYDGSRVHGHVLARAELIALADRLATLELAARMKLAGLEPKRADVIVMGAEIVRRVLLWSGAERLVVSDRGVRWGVAQRLAIGHSLAGAAPPTARWEPPRP